MKSAKTPKLSIKRPLNVMKIVERTRNGILTNALGTVKMAISTSKEKESNTKLPKL